MANTARALVAQMLAPLSAPTRPRPVVVHKYLSPPETVAKHTVLLSVEEVRPAVAQGLREYDVALLLTVPKSMPGAADDELDLLLDDVLELLESNAVPNAVTWSKAERSTFREATPAYLVTLTVTTSIEF